MTIPPFHLAFPVDDLAEARRFYGELLGCPEGRSAEHWIDFDLHGHQIVAHLAPEIARARATNPVDGEDVPILEVRRLEITAAEEVPEPNASPE